jgi:hypothetical protein
MNKRLVRWLILCLLVANGLLFFWPENAVIPPPGENPRVKRLVLLEEVEQEPIARAPSRANEVATPAPAEPAIDEPAEQVFAAETDERLQIEFVESSQEVPAESEEQVAAVEPEPEPEPEPVPERCWLAGPVESTALTESLTGEFAAVREPLNLVLRRVATEPDHWVYLKVDGGLEERRRLSLELRERGIDHFPITDGELSGNLSLGLFRSPDGAQILAARVREEGYPVETFLRPRYREEAWVALGEAARIGLGWSDEPGLLLQHPEMRIEEQDCAADGG